MNISPVINYSYSRQAQHNNNINFKNYSETFRKALTTPINNKKDASYIEQIDDVQNKSGIIHNVETLKNNQVNTLSSKKTEQEPTQSIAPIKQYDDELIVQKLITVDALSQKEKALVRIRKKETEENLK